MTQVITYQAPSGTTVNLTRRQIRMLERAEMWLRNSRGEEYCQVSHGLHIGVPTHCDDAIKDIIAADSH